MPKITYVPRSFSAGSLAVIAQANEIIAAYQAQDLTLTLRQLYYRFVAAGLITNRQSEYKRLGSIINDGRLAGLIDWEAIEDRTRDLHLLPRWASPADIVSAAARQFRVDWWKDQPYHVEVWVEKQALEAVVRQAADAFDCASYACKGYASQSEMWRAAMRFRECWRRDQQPVIIHLGDHDPSGVDMTRDIRDRLAMFGVAMEVNRIALNMDQIKEHQPPPNPAKLSDSRVQGYIAEFGSDSWELDALEPATLRDLIQGAIQSYCDMDKLELRKRQQERDRAMLSQVSENWTDIVTEFCSDAGPGEE